MLRLQQCGVSVGGSAPRKEGQSRLLSNWELGSDPSDYVWSPSGAKRDGEDEANRKRRQVEARRRRRAEKLGLQRNEVGEASTQPMPQIKHSSQLQEPMSQQTQSSAPPQIMSQPAGRAVRCSSEEAETKEGGRVQVRLGRDKSGTGKTLQERI